jgi:15-cis-phytoene desaturase
MNRQRHVIVVGAGLAGLAAAVELVETGCRVTVLERAPFVGGRTASWDDDGMTIETGLHRYLGFYTHLPRLIERAGSRLDDVVIWEDEIEILTPDGGPGAVFGASMLHRPGQTIGGVLGNNNFLPPGQKVALAAMLAAGAAEYVNDPVKLDGRTVVDLAHDHGVSDETVFRVLTPLTEGLFFVPPEEYSAYNFLSIIVPYWKSAIAVRVGAFAGGMTDVLAQPIADHLVGGGGEVRTGAEVDALLIEGDRIAGVSAGGRQLRSDAVVLATSIGPAQRLVGQSLGTRPWFQDLLALDTTPAVTLQLDLDEPCLPVDRVTFGPGTALASFSEQSRTTFRDRPGRLSVILARPSTFLAATVYAVADQVVADAARLGIALTGHITDARKVVLPMDFYSLRRGSEALRPAQATPVRGLALAGDYTRQEFLATMEGAVVSGLRAAAAVREQLD